MKKRILATLVFFTVNKYYTQTVNTFTANNAQITDTLFSGGIIEANCIHAADTIVADRDIIANEDIRVSGDIILGGKLITDNTNDVGMTYFPASNNSSSVSIFSFGRTVGPLNPIINHCPVASLMPSPWLVTSGGFISAVTNPNNQVNASLKMYTTTWNGFGHIELEGVNEVGFDHNALEINYYCGRATHINKNSSLANGGGWVRMGAQVSMDKHVEIGDPVNGIGDPNNEALNINANAGTGLKLNTSNNDLKFISINNVNFPGASPFTVFGNGKTIIGTEKVVGSHNNALLQVAGKVACKSLYVLKPTTWQDKIFSDDFILEDLEEVDAYIKKYKHLEGIPSEEEVLENGYDLNEMDAALLGKTEKIFLYLIHQKRQIESHKQEVSELKNEIKELRALIEKTK